jgi:glutamate-1-semialdehyde 2,1-aminomutase
MNQVVVAPSKSERLFKRAQEVMPGGVNSPVRALKSVDATPIFMAKADGPYLYDVDGNRYIDYIGSWGPMILGHCHPRVLEAVEHALVSGTSFGAPTQGEVEMAELICQSVPSIEMVRLTSSGTEACMSAVRLARAFTKRKRLIKFDGCYHGHADSFLVQAGSGMATLGIAASPGVPEEFINLTISLPFNSLKEVEKAFAKYKDEIACVIVEPVVGNAGLILPEEGYLAGLREITEKHGALLIFDEVMTGFRLALGGAQECFKIKPDLTCLGKIIGGGLPVGAYGGRKDIMQMVAPQGDVYQAGTLSGNPLATAAGVAQLKMLHVPHTYEHLETRTKVLADGLNALKEKSSMPYQVVSITGMICVFFTDKPVHDFAQAKKCDTAAFSKFWHAMKDKGIYWPPSQFESAFISLVHSNRDIQDTLDAFAASVA